MDNADFIILWINKLLVPDSIYTGIEAIARGIFTTVTPVLLVIAIAIRATEESLDLTNSNGRWINAARDTVIIGLAITVYFAAGNLVNDLFSVLYRYFEGVGSISSISSQMGAMIEQLESNTADTGFFNWAISGLWNNLIFGVYYLSLIAFTTTLAFLHLAQALGYGLAFCWGLIAIPISVSRHLKLLKGWALFMAFILLWPIIESLVMGLVFSVFADVAKLAVIDPTGNTSINQSAVALAFTVLNIVLIVLVVVVPFVTNALVANATAGKDFVVPFIAGGLTAAAAIYKGTQQGARRGGGPGYRASRDLLQRSDQAIRSVGEKIMSPPGQGSFPKVTTSNTGSTTQAQQSSKAGKDPSARQARRGAIINQNSKG